jgi:DNA-binding MarR family transcriptional regulator
MATAKQIESLRKSFCRFLRFGNQLMRGQASCCPVTMEQYNTLEALLEDSKSMKDLASEVGFHQSTMTRIVEKLNAQELVLRTRERSNQRHVDVEITEKGKKTCLSMRDGCSQMISWLLDAIPVKERASVVKSMENFTSLLNPDNSTFQEMYQACCCRADKET